MAFIANEQARLWRRTAGGIDPATGYASGDAYTDLGLIDITVLPVEGDEVSVLPEGIDTRKWLKGFTTTNIEIADGESNEAGDLVEYKGEFFEVRHRQRYPKIIPHDRILMRRTDRPKVLP